MRKKILISCFIGMLLASPGLSAQQGGSTNLSIKAGSGIFYGRMGEYVFNNTGKISELQWDMEGIFFFTSGLSFQWGRFLFNCSYLVGIPREAGRVTDYDWNYNNVQGVDLYSRHSARTDSLHEAEVDLLYSFCYIGDFSLYGGFAYRYSYYRVEALGGYQEYPAGTGTISQTFSGRAMRYRQQYHIASMVVGCSYEISPITISLKFAYSPLNFCQALDNHYLTNANYQDSMSFGHYFSGSLTLAYRFTDSLALELSGSASGIPLFKGKTTQYNTNTGVVTHYPNGSSGASLWQAHSSLSMRYFFSL